MRTITTDNGIAYECVHHPNYFITESGILYSIYLRGRRGETDVNNPHVVCCGHDKDGYCRVVLSSNGNKSYVKIHTLVVEQFIGDIIPPLVVNHIDGNKQNNDITNLEIVSVAENTRHAHEHGLTTSDVQVDVEVDGDIFHFNSLSACTATFPDLRKDYLKQLRNNIISFRRVSIIPTSNGDMPRYECFYNGRKIADFKYMKDVDACFEKCKGTTSEAIKIGHNLADRLNKYHVTFPNVSTIETS